MRIAIWYLGEPHRIPELGKNGESLTLERQDGPPLKRIWLPDGRIVPAPLGRLQAWREELEMLFQGMLFLNARGGFSTTAYLSGTAPVTAQPFTMSARGKPGSTSGSNRVVMGLMDTATTTHYFVLRSALATQNIEFSASAGGSAATASAGAASTVWTHYGCYAAAANSRAVFRDGANKGTNTTNLSPSSIDTLGIGAFVASSVSSPFNGDIAECAMWNDDCTDAEMALLGTDLVHPFLVNPVDLVFYSPLLGRFSPETDRVQSRNLTLTGSPSYADHPPVGYPNGRPQTIVIDVGVSASGAVTLPGLSAAGDATQTQSATGTPSLPGLQASGVGQGDYVGTGAPTLPQLSASGAASHQQIASGAATLSQLGAAGSAEQRQEASGAVALQQLAALGAALADYVGTGAPTLPSLTGSGAAVQTQQASGAPSLPPLQAAGSATHPYTASGAPTLPSLTASGAAAQSQIASGAPSVPSLTALGAAAQSQIANGASTLPQLAATGTAVHTAGGAFSATGAPTLPSLTALGTGKADYVSSGAAALPGLQANGAALESQAASGAPSLPSLIATGQSAQSQSASGAASLPALQASGQAGQSMSGIGAVLLPALTAAGTALHGVLVALSRITLTGRRNPDVDLSGRRNPDVDLEGRHNPDVDLEGRSDPDIDL